MHLLSGWSRRLGASNGDFHFLFYNFFFQKKNLFQLQASNFHEVIGAGSLAWQLPHSCGGLTG